MGLNIEVILMQKNYIISNRNENRYMNILLYIDIYSGISTIKCDKIIQLKVYDANLANFFQLNALSAIL